MIPSYIVSQHACCRLEYPANVLTEHKRKYGTREGDYTSFLASQQDWGEDRCHRPGILFQLHPAEEDKQSKRPGNLTYHDATDNVSLIVVGDFTNRPLKHYRDLPARVSTMAEGWLLEAWFRRNPGLHLDDILDRMFELNRDAVGREKLRKNMTEKRTNFRLRARCVSWSTNASHSAMKDRELQHLLLLPQYSECLRENTTVGLEDRTIQELRQLKQETKASGKYRASNTRLQASAARDPSDANEANSPTSQAARPSHGRFETGVREAPMSIEVPVESGNKRKWNSSYLVDKRELHAKPRKRQQQEERSSSDWQRQDYGCSSPNTTHAVVEDEIVSDGGAMFPLNFDAQTQVNAVFTCDADLSDEEFQHQIDCLMHEIPSWVESPGTAASGGPPSTRSSAILTPGMPTISQNPGLSSFSGIGRILCSSGNPSLDDSISRRQGR